MMNSSNHNFLNDEDEHFLNKLEKVFKEEQEKNLIKQEVSRKIASTKFAAPGGNHNFFNFRFILPLTVLIAVVAFFAFFLNKGENHKAVNNQTVGIKPVETKDKENQAVNPVEISKKLSSKTEKNTDLKHGSGQQSLAIKGFTGSSYAKTYSRTDSTSISINGYDIDKIENSVEILLRKYKLKFTRVNDDRYRLFIRTDDARGINKEGDNISYYINLKIKEDDPSKLNIYFVHHTADGEIRKQPKQNAEKAFYSFKNELRKSVGNK